MIGWGVNVVIRGPTVYEMINFFGPGWERKRIEKRLERKL
ncbi:MAG: 2TM domain-containing protein [Proteobacteria bacterium]|nr:2TM domain-containing protein [Pseudomonadota bacterium]